jgi:hypothetical protein
MAQRHIVESVEDPGIHIVHAPYGHLLGIAAPRAGDELMGHQDIACFFVYFHTSYCYLRRLLIAFRQSDASLILRPFLQRMPHGGRLHEREQMDADFPIAVLQRYLQGLSPIHRRYIYASPPHQLAAEGNPLRGVMVAADRQDLLPQIRQPGEEPVEHLHGLRGGHRLVIDVPRYEHRIHLLPLRYLQNLVQDIFLILCHGKLVDALSDMQIRDM